MSIGSIINAFRSGFWQRRQELARERMTIYELCRQLNDRDDQIAALQAQVLNAEMDGPKRTLEKSNDAQAARSMSRQTKQHFQAYQAAVGVILDQLNEMGKGNVVTKEDLRKLRQLRLDLGAMLRRSI